MGYVNRRRLNSIMLLITVLLWTKVVDGLYTSNKDSDSEIQAYSLLENIHHSQIKDKDFDWTLHTEEKKRKKTSLQKFLVKGSTDEGADSESQSLFDYDLIQKLAPTAHVDGYEAEYEDGDDDNEVEEVGDYSRPKPYDDNEEIEEKDIDPVVEDEDSSNSESSDSSEGESSSDSDSSSDSESSDSEAEVSDQYTGEDYMYSYEWMYKPDYVNELSYKPDYVNELDYKPDAEN